MRVAISISLLTLAACAAKTPLPNPHHGLQVRQAMTSTTSSLGMYPPQWGLPSRVIDTKRRMAVPLEQALDDLMSSKVVYVAESHNNPHHHAVQGAVVAHLWRRDRSLAIGMEMFQRPFQAALDAYLSGAEEKELLEKSEYEERWGYDFALYRPIAELARAHQIPIRALNAASELTKKVSKKGLASLSDEELKQLPELDLSSKAHREMVHRAFDGHGMDESRFEHFYAAQVIWDETMADEVARSLSEEDGPKRMVVLAGSGHIRFGFGIPNRAARRGAKPYRVVVPVMLGDDEPPIEELLEDPPGDYLWVMSLDASKLPEIGVPVPEPRPPAPATVTSVDPKRDPPAGREPQRSSDLGG
jgi:uncharacterized iron-regulated protein